MSIGAGEPKFRIWLTMSAGGNENVTPGKRLRQHFAQLLDVLGRRRVAFLERDLDVAVLRADDAGVVVGQVDARDRQADVVDHRLDLLRRNDFADAPSARRRTGSRLPRRACRPACARASGSGRHRPTGRNSGRGTAAARTNRARTQGSTRRTRGGPRRRASGPCGRRRESAGSCARSARWKLTSGLRERGFSSWPSAASLCSR